MPAPYGFTFSCRALNAEAEAMRQQRPADCPGREPSDSPRVLHHRQAADWLPIPRDARRPALPPRCPSDRGACADIIDLTHGWPRDSFPKQRRCGRCPSPASAAAASARHPASARSLHAAPASGGPSNSMTNRSGSGFNAPSSSSSGKSAPISWPPDVMTVSAMNGTAMAIGEITISPLPRQRRISTHPGPRSRQRAHPVDAHSRDRLPERP